MCLCISFDVRTDVMSFLHFQMALRQQLSVVLQITLHRRYLHILFFIKSNFILTELVPCVNVTFLGYP